MVISNSSSGSQIQSAHQTTGESFTTVEKREEQQDEWRAAVETVLPHLLGQTRFSMEKRAALSYNEQTEEDNRPKTYMNAFCDFGRWIGKFGNNCLRSWTMGRSNRKLSAVSLTPSRMKDFFVLLGNYITYIMNCNNKISFEPSKTFKLQKTFVSNNSWMKTSVRYLQILTC